MLLSVGSRLGPYEIVALLGAGGMGEVYRARDTKLNRDVAIKVLLAAVANDHERLLRFQREAQVLASLNHPNIAHIHGLEDSGGVPALIMELVEGPTLADRIARGPIPIDEALPIARQIAEALEAAHEQGIIHRDLKPANINVRPDGAVKVLDFGLAKIMEPPTSSPGVSQSPTITTPAMTQAGMILGTAAYMSPEQARGKTVDKRADIWAFGVVVFEMLTGRRAFEGEDVSVTLVSVMMKDPDWGALPTPTPARLRRLLNRCLKKDAKARMRDIGEARQQIEDLLNGAPEETPAAASVSTAHMSATSRRWVVVAASVALLVVAAAVATATWVLMRTPLAKPQEVRFAIVPVAAQGFAINRDDRVLAISPDGTHLVYVIRGGLLMVRAIDQLEAVPLPGITGARSPFFSADGRWIGFFSAGSNVESGNLKKVSITGGPPVTLCRFSGSPRGASWAPDDTIVFATSDSSTGLLRVSAAGGEPTVLTSPDTAHGEQDHLFPSVLPGGRAVMFTVTVAGSIDLVPVASAADNAQVAVLDLATGQRKALVRGGSQAEYVETGHLVYAVAATLRAVRFNPVKLEVVSDPVSVVEQVMTVETGAAEFSVSRQGTLVYIQGGSAARAARSLVWVNRHGQEEPIKAPPRAYVYPRLSPDGTRVALDVRDQEQDIWIWDLARQILMRLTDAPTLDAGPVWTPDGRRVIFASTRAGGFNLFWQAADKTGTVDRLTTSAVSQYPTSISPDGTLLIVREFVPKVGNDLRVLRLEGLSGRRGPTPATPLATGPRQTEPLMVTAFNEENGEISPDGHWLAYQSNASGQDEISVRPFPHVDGGHWQISTSGGTKPAWARNGRELFYLDGTDTLTAVSVHTAPTFSADAPTKLFDARYYSGLAGRPYDVSPDGQRFLMIKENASSDQTSTSASMIVVVNWFDELKARVPTK